MLRTAMALVLGLTVAVLWTAGPASADEQVLWRQKSSHDAAFFQSLLSGRVWVYHSPAWKSASKRAFISAAYFHVDGQLTVCAASPSGGLDYSGRWRVVPSIRFGTLFNYIGPGDEPDPMQSRRHWPIFYEPETGQLHHEDWVSEDSWRVYLRGWVQESWPASLLRECPDVRPPAAVPVNEKQQSVVFRVLMREDPAAPLRAFPGSDQRVPGARGLAAAGHQPTFPAEALRAWLVENNGTVARSGTRKYALALNRHGDELWLLDEDTDAVVETIRLIPSEDGGGVVLHFTEAGARFLYRLGYPLGLMATGERFGAMALTDWLVEQGEPVALPFMDRENVGFRFLPDGGLRVGTRAGVEVGGEWWWSKGLLHLRVDGIETVNTFEWCALARHVGWER